ncbi:cation:proton antiporter [Nemorincola caseinilytica]|uniref:Cation:proton antiporter n=1 Tax=Nemorincola caseinilytica TaxID=2054315 RepID=A0ABP8N6P7_9BACT
MTHLPPLISDLGLVMGAAAVVTLVFKRLKQPTVLGYILAGIMVGPHFPLFPSVADTESVDVWAQIGVIVLLFCLGLEFSFKKLMRVGGTASVTAVTEIGTMLLMGFGVGKLLGWSTTDCIFLGTMLSISSTTIIIRAFDELGVKEKKFTGLVFGVLIVQDLAAILMLVLLPTVAASTKLSGTAILFPVGKLIFFLVLWFVSGIFFLPTILRRAGRFMNNEMLLVTSLALCFMMVILAAGAGFSPALGAFIMGSILAETPLGGKIEHLTVSIKEMFGAVFFVSVGMMIDPNILPQYWQQILIIMLVVLVAMPFSTIVGALLSRQPFKISVQAGMSLSQIGEFSFIIATMGLTMKLTGPHLYPVAVAVSALTAFTTPYMIRLSGPLYNWLTRRLPGNWVTAIDKYSHEGQKVKPTSDWNKYITSYLIQTVIHTILVVGIVLVVSNIILPALDDHGDNPVIRIGTAITTLLLIAPLLWALAIRKIYPSVANRLWEKRYYRGPMIVLQLLRLVIAFVIMGFVVHNIVSYTWALILLGVTLITVLLNYRRLQLVHSWAERRFMTNLNEKEVLDKRESGAHLTPWDAHITNFVVSPDFKGVGMTLMELKLRENYGVNIAMIKRGAFTIQAPDRQERIYPEDTLYVIGTDDQVISFKKHLEESSAARARKGSPEDELTLQRMEIAEGSPIAGMTIKASEIRERTKGLIVGIERNGERILNPESNVVLLSNDLLWIVGNIKRIKVFEKIVGTPQRVDGAQEQKPGTTEKDTKEI